MCSYTYTHVRQRTGAYLGGTLVFAHFSSIGDALVLVYMLSAHVVGSASVTSSVRDRVVVIVCVQNSFHAIYEQ